MLTSVLTIKLDQTYLFDGDGKRQTATLVSTGPSWVVSIRKKDKDGYDAVVLGIGERRMKTVKKPVREVFKKAGFKDLVPRFIKEIKTTDDNLSETFKIGSEIEASQILAEGDTVDITGTSKGKGFAGVVKRHHFKGGPRTHGQSDRERAPGSIGMTTTPGRVFKGKRMAGRMGNDTVTVRNLKIIKINAAEKTMYVSGLVPGGKNSVLIIRKHV